MSNYARLSTPLKTTRSTAIKTAIDAAATAGKFLCYTAPIPVTGAVITTQTLLAELVMSDPCGTVTAGVLTFSAVTSDSSANAAGDIAWVRAVDGDNNFVADFDASLTGGTGAVQFSSLTTVVGASVNMTSATITEG
jgi:hypothetical protein